MEAISWTRVFQLTVAMLVFGGVWYMLTKRRLISEGKEEDKASETAKGSAIKTAIIFGGIYMVLELGALDQILGLFS